jgi:hypothetical protein
LEIFERPWGGGIVMVNFAKDTLTNRSRARRVRVCGNAIALLLALNQIAPAPAYADDSPRDAEHNAIRRMNEQIQELQAKVKELEARLNAEAPGTSVQTIESRAPATTHAKEAQPPPTSMVQESREEHIVPSVKLRMFGDAGYLASTQKGSIHSFRIGALDLFMTGTLTDRVSVLGEVLLAPTQHNTIALDLERLLFQYKQNDYVRFAIGRYHTAIGYYNTAFHQGAWFQTAIKPPFMYAFDEQGGFLPSRK